MFAFKKCTLTHIRCKSLELCIWLRTALWVSCKTIIYRLIDLQRLHLSQHCLFSSTSLHWFGRACSSKQHVHMSSVSYKTMRLFIMHCLSDWGMSEILSKERWAEFSRCRNTCLCLLHTLLLFWLPGLSMNGSSGMLTSDPHSIRLKYWPQTCDFAFVVFYFVFFFVLYLSYPKYTFLMHNGDLIVFIYPLQSRHD